MGPPRSHRRVPKAPLPLRSRTTRSSKSKLLSDPEANTQLLTEQLRQLGLYAADTTGDGNCLFRALSDQLFGTESRHLQLRKDICDWIQTYSLRYAPFVDDERGLDVHLSLMRQPATYGGHLELSAFAHMKRCNVKVIQPGLVYLIEWAAGWDPATMKETPASSSSSSLATTLIEREPVINDRSRRAARRESRKAALDKANAGKAAIERADDDDDDDESPDTPTVYVAYHDWEHFSSIRNLRGPHAGLPNVQELPGTSASPELPPTPKTPSKPNSKAHTRTRSGSAATTKLPAVPVSAPKPLSRPRRSSRTLRPASVVAPTTPAPTPADIPLPSSRSASPSASAMSPAAVALRTRGEREHRSPKRSFDESSGSSEASAAAAPKRTRRGTVRGLADLVRDADMEDGDGDADEEGDAEGDTPALSETGSLSPISSPSPSPSPPPAPPPVQMTKRQRKAAGLPKHGRGAGKIVIPGGRFRATTAEVGAGEAEGEWTRNGTGRVDVRGFRELRI
ncbi:hypothetical protein BC834DRAFT_510962 [Gloeopeniophorella convolvens]|nr:hypothetical protein BC834DRAFT_510962 [Gloeopeniophorella convolvens]